MPLSSERDADATVHPSQIRPIAPADVREGILELCAIGNRFAGSAGERAARDVILREFRAAGLANVRADAFELIAYRPGPGRCQLAEGGEAFVAEGLQFTAAGEVEAEAIYAGRLLLEELDAFLDGLDTQGLSVEGRIVVMHSPYPYMVCPGLAERGAAGFVVISEAPDGLIRKLTAHLYPTGAREGEDGGPLRVPGVTVELQSGERLVELVRKGPCRLRLAHDGSYESVATANVVGELPGAVAPDERVVIGGHYDCQLDAPGANDNASGISALFAIARSWRSLSPRRTVVFVAFADEEHGMRGSVSYLRRYVDTLDSTVGMVCVDALGWSSEAQRCLVADPSIRDFAVDSGSAVGWEPSFEFEASRYVGSDFNPFVDAGIPALQFWRFPPVNPYYHTPGDNPDNVDFDAVADTATVAAYTTWRLANEPELGLGRSRPTRRWADLRPGAR